MSHRSHWEVLSVTQLQSDRLVRLLTAFLASQFDMQQFGELMCSIVSPSAHPPMLTGHSD